MSSLVNTQSFASNPNFPSGATLNYVPTCTNATTGAWTWQATSSGGGPTLSGSNAWTGTNTFNTNLPTSTVTPSSGTQLITKTYGDTTYGSLGAANAWTNTNSFNSSLPSSTVTPVNATDLITKTYADSTYLAAATFQTFAVQTTNGTATTIQTIATASNTHYTIMGWFSALDTAATSQQYSTFGMLLGDFVNKSGTVTLPGNTIYYYNNFQIQLVVSGTNVLVQVIGGGGVTINWKWISNVLPSI